MASRKPSGDTAMEAKPRIGGPFTPIAYEGQWNGAP
jgi:hypothetical protein